MKTKILISIIFSLIAGYVHCQSVIQSANSDELIEQLNPNSSLGRTRGFRNLTPEVREKPSVDLSIQFEFDSAKLLPESKPLLDSLAKAINSDKLKGYAFVIEGHTDNVGTLGYNQNLSSRRAASVLNYLSSVGVNKTRLKAIGKGSSDLLLPDRPDASENRRVKIILNS